MAFGVVLLIVWLILLIRFPRVMLRATGVLVIVAGVFAAGAAFWQWQQRQRVERIDFDIRYDAHSCNLAQPIRVRLINQSGRDAVQVHWELKAVQPGYSTNLVDTSSDAATYRTEKRLADGEAFEQCLPPPRLRSGYRARDLEYRADRIRVDFD
ncbi:hypothetical protein KEM63_02740 [Halopseudomonas nanhaiensis]|uniref:hypothetical protein n=1 Tax=Halopseudomonas nanhaiensis TaxID=2830842 RepID=UPI001CBC65AE|nr:hypothetical protein [Halopseudomonas nanhaiensis]UAW98915.1 hypothetical protein KEM63_02740 [Halopseudomonas nanhaiensis]